MTCQSLQSVATYLKFDWNTPHPFRELFKARLFDYLGKLDIDGRGASGTPAGPGSPARSRWSTPTPPGASCRRRRPGKGDEFADFRGVDADLLRGFQVRRLEALEHVAARLPRQPATPRRRRSCCPTWPSYEDKARDLAHALHEFVTIERHVELDDWKAPGTPRPSGGC